MLYGNWSAPPVYPPAASPQGKQGVFACRGLCAVHPRVSYREGRAGRERQAYAIDTDLAAPPLRSEESPVPTSTSCVESFTETQSPQVLQQAEVCGLPLQGAGTVMLFAVLCGVELLPGTGHWIFLFCI